jgi:dihydroxyacid dehydratase/phosphogluconate dehydratase
VAKISGNEGEYFEGDAIVYENDVIKGVRAGEVKPGNVVVIGIVDLKVGQECLKCLNQLRP